MIESDKQLHLSCYRTQVSQIVFLSLIVYASAYIFLGVYNNRAEDNWIGGLCALSIIAMSIMFLLPPSLPRTMELMIIFFFQLITAIIIQEMIRYNTGSIWGLYEGDGLTYYYYIADFRDISLQKMREYYSDINWDDFGMLIFMRFIRLLSFKNSVLIPFVFILINSISITISSNIFYKISSFFLTETNSKIASVIWGGNLYWAFISSHYMKENIFLVIITFACYYYIKVIKEKKNMVNIAMFLLFAFLTSLFRLVYPFIILLAATGYFFRKLFYDKRIILVGVSSILFIIYISSIINLFSRFSGIASFDYEHLSGIFDSRTSFTSNRFLAISIMFISSVFGPFCTINPGKQPVLLLYSFYFLFKSFLSFFLLYGLYNLYLSKHFLFPFVFIYLFLSILMMVISSVGLDFRFQASYYPLLLIVSLYGLESIVSNKTNIFLLFSGYVLCICSLTYLYNLR